MKQYVFFTPAISGGVLFFYAGVKIIKNFEAMNESIIELLHQLPVSAMVGRTYDGYKGGWMCCSYYEAIKDHRLLDYAPDVTDNDLLPLGYGTTPEEAIRDCIRQYSRG